MRTFKLISLQVVEENGFVEVTLEDGLVINKEDGNRTWLLEAYVSTAYQDYFQKILEKGESVSLQIVISRPENDPAYFQSQFFSMNPISSQKHLSLLFKGTISRSPIYAEQLLEHLIDIGLAGKDLLHEFKEKMKTRPSLSSLKNQR